MASPSAWFGTLVYPSPDAMKISNTNEDGCTFPLINGIHKPTETHINNENSQNSLDGHVTLASGHNHQNDFDVRDDKYLSVPNQIHRASRDEPPAMRHPSIDIPFSFPAKPHPDVIAEMANNDDLNIHLQNLAMKTAEQMQNHPNNQRIPRNQRKSGLQGIPDAQNSYNTLLKDNEFFALNPLIDKWIEYGNCPGLSLRDDPTYFLDTQNNVEKTKEEEMEKTEEEEMEKMGKCVADRSVMNWDKSWGKRLVGRQSLVRQHLVQVENRLFEMFGDKEKQTINVNKFLVGLMATGLRHTDPRLKEMRKNLKKVQERLAASDPQALDVDYETFMEIISENLEIVVKAFSSSFVIPDFRNFCHHIQEIYSTCKANNDGQVALYIPQLARMNPDHWGVSICTVDGQRLSLGDVNVPFTLQSCSKPLNYALALAMTGTDPFHNFVGMEPSGRYFNELVLDYNNKPHNPMINAGAIMTAALIKANLSAADRFDYVFSLYKRLVAGEYLGFNNAVFLSERECADRNFALAYFMRENKCFPEGTRLHETLDFYFQLCSLEITAESGALMAATLANGGINPLTGDPVLTVEAVRNTLTLMHSCGMYNYSGQFAFKVGLPSKSGVSGCVLVVVPNTMGICLWSPPLDSNGNSCRSVQFCMELVSKFKFHNFDNLRGYISTKTDPRVARAESKAQILFDLLFSAAAGDLSALRRHSLSGTDMEAKDYDGRTALHVAASEGHFTIVEYLLKNCQVNPLPKDRWDRTPLDDARSFGHPRCASLLVESCNKRGLPVPSPPTEEVTKA